MGSSTNAHQRSSDVSRPPIWIRAPEQSRFPAEDREFEARSLLRRVSANSMRFGAKIANPQVALPIERFAWSWRSLLFVFLGCHRDANMGTAARRPPAVVPAKCRMRSRAVRLGLSDVPLSYPPVSEDRLLERPAAFDAVCENEPPRATWGKTRVLGARANTWGPAREVVAIFEAATRGEALSGPREARTQSALKPLNAGTRLCSIACWGSGRRPGKRP